MDDIFNSREIATALWLSLFIIWGLTKSEVRAALRTLIKASLKWQILVPLLAMFGYVLLVVVGLNAIGFWDGAATKDTVLWVLGAAVIMLFRANKANEEANFFKDAVFDNLKLIAVLEFVSNAYTFSFPIELVLVPLITFTAMLKAVTGFKVKTEADYRAVDNLLGYVLGIAALVLIGVAVYQAVQDLDGFVTVRNLRDFLLPAVLSGLYLPFVYAWALFLAYEHVFVRIDMFNKNRELARHLKKMVLVSFHVRLRGLVRWSRRVPNLRITSRSEAATLIKEPASKD